MVALQRWSSKTFLRKAFIESFNKFLAGLFGHADAGDNVAFGCAAVDGDIAEIREAGGGGVGLHVC